MRDASRSLLHIFVIWQYTLLYIILYCTDVCVFVSGKAGICVCVCAADVSPGSGGVSEHGLPPPQRHWIQQEVDK